MTNLDFLIEQDVTVRRTTGGVILAIIITVGLIMGLLGVGLTGFIVSVSHTEQGLCGSLGIPCTSLSLSRVDDLSELNLPAGSEVTGGYYSHTTGSTKFWASVRLPPHASVALDEYQPYGTPAIPAELAWARRMHSVISLGESDGDTVHSVISGVDSVGNRELFLSFTSGG